MRTAIHLTLSGGLLLGALLACGGSGGGTAPPTPNPTPAPTTATVTASPSLAFSPTPVTVAPGGTVTFAFGTVGHNVYFDAASGAPADITGSNANVSIARTFATAGTYTYSCHIHPGMKGTIVVNATQTTTPGTGGGYGYP